jgi:hypothetical protein
LILRAASQAGMIVPFLDGRILFLILFGAIQRQGAHLTFCSSAHKFGGGRRPVLRVGGDEKYTYLKITLNHFKLL